MEIYLDTNQAMAEYPPPTIIEPIFNPTDFPYLDNTGSGGSSSGSYVNYPSAQGPESFPYGLSTSSTMTFNGGSDYLTNFSQSGAEFTISQGTGNTMTVDVPACTFTNDVTMSDRVYFQYGGYINGGSASGSVINLVADEIDIVANTMLLNALPISSYSSMSQDASGNITMMNNLTVDGNISGGSVTTSSVSYGSGNLNMFSDWPSSGTGSNIGLGLYWDYFTGTGEVDLLGIGQGGAGGFSFFSVNSAGGPVNLANFFPSGAGGITFAESLPLTFKTLPTAPTAASTDNSTSLATTAFVQTAVSGSSSGNPVGTILQWGGNTTAPSGYLFCDGTAYSQTGTYANLYAVIGDTYDLGSTASGYFAVPNFHNGTSGSGTFPIAGGLTTGSTGVLVNNGNSSGPISIPSTYGGQATIPLTCIPDHEHNSNLSGNYVSSLSQGNYGIAAAGTYNVITSGTGSSFPSTTALMTDTTGTAVYSSTQSQSQYYGPFCAVMFIIKY